MGAKANLQTGSSEDINEVTGGPCTRPWPWSVPAVPCNKCNRLDSYCQHWRFCLGKVAACSSLLLGAKLLQLPVFSRDMNHEPAISTKTCAPFSLQQSRPCSAGQSPAPGRGRVQGRAADTYNCKIFANGFYNFMLCNFGVSGEVAGGVGQSVLLELGHWSGELVSTE